MRSNLGVARMFVSVGPGVPAWPGSFDIEIDCVAVRK